MRGRFLAFNDTRISGRSLVYGLIGDPVDHSMSPTIQNTAFRSAGLDAVYVAWRVTSSGLRSAVHGLRALDVRGFNVTTPHKTAITRHLDHLESFASRIQSVNTVTNERGKFTGFNTDGVGALRSLEEDGASLEGESVLLIGAGGAARAVAYALVERECSLTLMNRTLAKARRLAKRLQREFGANVACAQLSSRNLHTLLGEAQVVINASSMGMNGKSDVPIKPTWLKPEHYVFELVYRPLQTRLLQYAALAGARTISGLDMLVNQGACSFTLWTGKKAPLAQMRQAIAERLTGIGSVAR
jgi:shikimate dehydrogenase